jgi:UPF0755 protein
MPSDPEWRSPRGRRAAERYRAYRRNLATLCVLAVLLTPLAIASVWVLSNVEHSTAGNADVLVEVQPGWTSVQVGDALQNSGVVDSSAAFQAVAESAAFKGPYAAGSYDFVANSRPREALDTLRGGPRRIVPDLKLLLPPGLTLKQIAERVGKLQGKDAQRFLEIANSGTVRSRYEPADRNSLEGLTWPDTYAIGANDTETQILQKIVAQFDAKADAIGAPGSGPGNGGLSPYQAVISASLIEAEAGSKEDGPLISSVILNRLKAGMPLQIDADRKLDSPYNTYKIDGLPPTPIKTVSEVALRAALGPAPVPFLYYVSDKNGKTYYATTLSEHEKNVTKARNVG